MGIKPEMRGRREHTREKDALQLDKYKYSVFLQ